MTKFRKLGRPAGHRMSMLSVAFTLVFKDYGFSEHERIETTVSKGSLAAARQAACFVRGDDVLHMIFTEFAYRYKDRAGGLHKNAPYPHKSWLCCSKWPISKRTGLGYRNQQHLNHHNECPWTHGQRSRLTKQFAPPKEEKSSDSDL